MEIILGVFSYCHGTFIQCFINKKYSRIFVQSTQLSLTPFRGDPD